MLQVLLETLENVLNASILSHQPIGGGDINSAWSITTSGDTFFVKTNQHREGLALLETEVKGLNLLSRYSFISTPKVIDFGMVQGVAYLILEHISGGIRTSTFWSEFGTMLALLHQQRQPGFGLSFDNFIGTLPQSNRSHASGIEFIIRERFLPQMQMARDNGLLNIKDARQLDSLCQRLPDLIPEEPPSLIHGDLWSGNFMTLPDSMPVLIDPAVGCTSREFDLAMSRLFGGFAPAFYEAYQEAFPLEPGWLDRIDIFQLYYLLAHVNLFGGGYVNSVQSILNRYT